MTLHLNVERRPLFRSPRIQAEVPMSDCVQAVLRHLSADWGSVPARQKEENDRHFVARSGRLLSAYETSAGDTFWVVTESDWSCIAILFPEEFTEFQEVHATHQAILQGVQ